MAVYNFRISYIKGTENGKADTLSRKPEYLQNKVHKTYTILKEKDSVLIHNKLQLAASSRIDYSTIKEQLKAEYKRNATAKRILKNTDNLEKGFSIDKRFIYFHNKLYISSKLAKGYIREQHKLPVYKHQKVIRTFTRIRKEVYFPKMKTTIEKVVGNCNTYI
ncbi:hypothetical protein OCU04_012576 [Sclerotinia nivalis]|uniref:Integrase zinc-binding domain-containing protein n=1 Tax=Sclerotinia nivalis TaxID=352851 RepID=A0A9X0DD33_9HELO|nr:hypothetical protein OCU04_012576 [Sclerotinia nivalis]